MVLGEPPLLLILLPGYSDLASCGGPARTSKNSPFEGKVHVRRSADVQGSVGMSGLSSAIDIQHTVLPLTGRGSSLN